MKSRHLPAMFLLALCVNPSAHAFGNKTWADISDVGVVVTVGSALATPAVRADWKGVGQAALSIGVASGVSQGLKSVVHERRPDNSDNNSFPSGHAALSFAAATTLHRRYGWEIGFPAYAVATLTGVARERANKHFWYDVVAGAALGSSSGWLFTDAFNNKVQLVPWASSKGGGVLMGVAW